MRRGREERRMSCKILGVNVCRFRSCLEYVHYSLFRPQILNLIDDYTDNGPLFSVGFFHLLF